MVKVATPILYESALDELNRVRPLYLGDRSRLSIDLPVLSKNPVGTGRPIIGKFARCDEQGALLKNVGNSFHNYTYDLEYLNSGNPTLTLIYSQKALGVVFRLIKTGVAYVFFFMDSTFTKALWTTGSSGSYYMPFKGYRMYLRGTGSGNWAWTVHIYRFY